MCSLLAGAATTPPAWSVAEAERDLLYSLGGVPQRRAEARTIALIEKGTTVIGTITDPALVDKSVSNLKEVITRGAKYWCHQPRCAGVGY